jgi:uncharacterized membrane protein HdeD (DUF308 family)
MSSPFFPHARVARPGERILRPAAALPQARAWPLVLARAALCIALGAWAIAWPLPAVAGVAWLLAVFMLANGVLALASGLHGARGSHASRGLVLEGLAGLLAGALGLLRPGTAVLALVWLAAAWALVAGCAMTAAAFHLRMHRGGGMLALAGLLSVAWGVLLVFAPIAGAVAMAVWLGAYAIALGAAMAGLAIGLRRDARAAAASRRARPAVRDE